MRLAASHAFGVPMPNKNANPIDRYVGAWIRMQRMVRGLSQTELGKTVGVTFQQVQKYEKGVNRVGASRLQQIAVLKVRPDFFFEEASAKAVGNSGSGQTAIIEGFISSRDGIALSKAFINIRDTKIRRFIIALVEQIAEL
jgi:transcriptional regulator with XRE-family HTH domain